MTKGKLPREAQAAIKLLAEHHRMMVTIVPEGVSDRFCASLSSFVSYLLDVQLLPTIPMPAVKAGDGIVCPYCGAPASTKPDIEGHAEDCRFRQAIVRWGAAQLRIDQEFPQ